MSGRHVLGIEQRTQELARFPLLLDELEREAQWWQQWRGQDAAPRTLLGALRNGAQDGTQWGHDGRKAEGARL